RLQVDEKPELSNSPRVYFVLPFCTEAQQQSRIQRSARGTTADVTAAFGVNRTWRLHREMSAYAPDSKKALCRRHFFHSRRWRTSSGLGAQVRQIKQVENILLARERGLRLLTAWLGPRGRALVHGWNRFAGKACPPPPHTGAEVWAKRVPNRGRLVK